MSEVTTMKRFGIPIILAVLACVAAAVTLSLPGSHKASAGTPQGDLRVFRDDTQPMFLSVQLDSASRDAGVFDMYAPGAGLYIPTAPATITRHGSGSIDVAYNGAGTLDADATVDPLYGIVRPSGSPTTPVQSMNLAAHIEGSHTATAQFNAGARRLHLVSTPAPHTADATAASIVAALAARSWSTLYGFAYRGLTGDLTEAQFETWITSSLQGHGDVVSAAVAGPATYGDAASGFTTAQLPVTLTLTNGGAVATYNATLKMVFDTSRQWKFTTFQPAS